MPKYLTTQQYLLANDGMSSAASMQTEALANELAAGPTGAFGAAKRLLWSAWNTTLETQMAAESWTIAAQAHAADAREGITAFLEKRTPRFLGQ